MKQKINLSLILFLTYIFSFSQGNYIYLDDIEQGTNLERAKNTSLEQFFDRIISNGFELEKNPRKWKVVATTDQYIYYGHIQKAPNGEAIVENFSKTDAVKVKTYFPIYQNTDGINLKYKLYYLFIYDLEQKSLRPTCDKRYKIVYDKHLFNLTEKGIQVYLDVKGFCYDDKVLTVRVNTILDPNSLEVLEQNNQVIDLANPENNIEIDSKSKFKNLLNDIKINTIK